MEKEKNPAAVALGRLGGRSRSPAKLAAVKRNGFKKGNLFGKKRVIPKV